MDTLTYVVTRPGLDGSWQAAAILRHYHGPVRVVASAAVDCRPFLWAGIAVERRQVSGLALSTPTVVWDGLRAPEGSIRIVRAGDDVPQGGDRWIDLDEEPVVLVSAGREVLAGAKARRQLRVPGERFVVGIVGWELTQRMIAEVCPEARVGLPFPSGRWMGAVDRLIAEPSPWTWAEAAYHDVQATWVPCPWRPEQVAQLMVGRRGDPGEQHGPAVAARLGKWARVSTMIG